MAKFFPFIEIHNKMHTTKMSMEMILRHFTVELMKSTTIPFTIGDAQRHA
jgi:hypothetical protein